MRLEYSRVIPYPFEAVLSQYFDYEHIAHVHPDTLGEYRVLKSEGNLLVYEQVWPRNRFGRRKRSVVEHEFLPPGEMWFRFVSGRYRGVRVHSRLCPHPEGTLVEETHHLPLPGWGWLARLIEKPALRMIDAIWEEDLVVDVCRDGWPGVPQGDSTCSFPEESRNTSSVSDDLPVWGSESFERSIEDLQEGTAEVFLYDGVEVAVFHHSGRLYALENRCPHTGGPLHLGALEGGRVVCPWHGARFELATGKCVEGPCARDPRIYPLPG
jgi:nitrite reductase/ring-hydroxylating ferredoxin subunit